MAGLQLPYGYDPTNPISSDERFGKKVQINGIDTTVPFEDLTEAAQLIPIAKRFPGMPIIVKAASYATDGAIIEHYWNATLVAFVKKTGGGEAYDQSLNKADSVEFAKLKLGSPDTSNVYLSPFAKPLFRKPDGTIIENQSPVFMYGDKIVSGSAVALRILMNNYGDEMPHGTRVFQCDAGFTDLPPGYAGATHVSVFMLQKDPYIFHAKFYTFSDDYPTFLRPHEIIQGQYTDFSVIEWQIIGSNQVLNTTSDVKFKSVEVDQLTFHYDQIHYLTDTSVKSVDADSYSAIFLQPQFPGMEINTFFGQGVGIGELTVINIGQYPVKLLDGGALGQLRMGGTDRYLLPQRAIKFIGNTSNKYLVEGGSVADTGDYFLPIEEDEAGVTHPAFSTTREAILWMLANGVSTTPPDNLMWDDNAPWDDNTNWTE